MAAEGLKWRVNRAVRASKLVAPAKLVMFVLSDMADAKTAQIPDAHTPSLAQLADETQLNVATVKRHLAALEKAGWVIRTRPNAEEKARHISTRYRLAIPTDGAQDAIETPEPMAQTEPSESEPMAQSAPSDGAQDAIAMAQGAPSSHIYDRHDQLHDQNLLSEGETDGALFAAPTEPHTNGSAAKKPDPGARFDEFYRAYPKHVAPDAAKRAWVKAISAGADPDVIIGAAAFFALERKMQDPKFTPHPATWINGGRWKDAPDPSYQAPPVRTGPWRNPEDPSDYYGDI